MSRQRILVDIEFTVDEDRFKLAQLTDDADGVSDVTHAAVRDAITALLINADWAAQALTPLHSIITTRALAPDGYYPDTRLAADLGVGDT